MYSISIRKKLRPPEKNVGQGPEPVIHERQEPSWNHVKHCAIVNHFCRICFLETNLNQTCGKPGKRPTVRKGKQKPQLRDDGFLVRLCTLGFAPRRCLLRSSFFSISFCLSFFFWLPHTLLWFCRFSPSGALLLRTSLPLGTARGRLGTGSAASRAPTGSSIWFLPPCKGGYKGRGAGGTYCPDHTTLWKLALVGFTFTVFIHINGK